MLLPATQTERRIRCASVTIGVFWLLVLVLLATGLVYAHSSVRTPLATLCCSGAGGAECEESRDVWLAAFDRVLGITVLGWTGFGVLTAALVAYIVYQAVYNRLVEPQRNASPDDWMHAATSVRASCACYFALVLVGVAAFVGSTQLFIATMSNMHNSLWFSSQCFDTNSSEPVFFPPSDGIDPVSATKYFVFWPATAFVALIFLLHIIETACTWRLVVVATTSRQIDASSRSDETRVLGVDSSTRRRPSAARAFDFD